ncbi:MAG: ComEC family competence protein, partial [Chitinophagales bacterium]|nr:ComEC family competence protein [Chitinophagales bacterium]
MNSWSQYPFVRIIIPFISGILIWIFFEIHFPPAILYSLIAISIVFHLLIRKRIFRMYRYTFYAGIVFQITILLSANHLCFVNTDINNENNYTRFINDGDFAIVKICEPLSEKEKSVSAEVAFYYFRNNLDWKACSGKAIIYFRKETAALQLHYGDFILVKNNFSRVNASKNPDEFNYQKFLYYKNIYATAFLDSSQFNSLHFSRQNPVWQFTFWLRQKSIDAFAKYISLDRERAVADALVIGDRDNMSFALMQSYSSTGVIHVLAVSGLHVAILYALLELLTFFIRKRKHGKFYQAIIILIIIWLFALVTGLSGSVTRAATMFTFITVGKAFRR